MLAQVRAGHADAPRTSGEPVRNARYLNRPNGLVMNGLEHAASPQVFIFIDLINAMGNPTGDLLLLKDL